MYYNEEFRVRRSETQSTVLVCGDIPTELQETFIKMSSALGRDLAFLTKVIKWRWLTGEAGNNQSMQSML